MLSIEKLLNGTATASMRNKRFVYTIQSSEVRKSVFTENWRWKDLMIWVIGYSYDEVCARQRNHLAISPAHILPSDGHNRSIFFGKKKPQRSLKRAAGCYWNVVEDLLSTNKSGPSYGKPPRNSEVAYM